MFTWQIAHHFIGHLKEMKLKTTNQSDSNTINQANRTKLFKAAMQILCSMFSSILMSFA
jgi:hypothetical protein